MGPSSISGLAVTVFIAATASRNGAGSAEVTAFDGSPNGRHAATGAPIPALVATNPLPVVIGPAQLAVPPENRAGRFSRCAARPSCTSGPLKLRNSRPSDVSKVGPNMRYQ